MVSIIIPNYNHKTFLKRRIETVLNQSCQDFELILLDDASTDGSVEILKQYEAHHKVGHVHYNSINSGSVFKQWIKAIHLAKGEFVWIAESDDYSDLTFLESTLKVLQNNKNLGMVFTDSYKVDENGQHLGLVSKSKKVMDTLKGGSQIINKSNCTTYLLENIVIVNASSVLFRKSALINVDFNVLKKLKNYGDIFVYMGIVLNHDAYFLPEPLNFMRLHDQNTTKKNKINGLIYNDRILFMNHYLPKFKNLDVVSKNAIRSFVNGFIFFSIDFGYANVLNNLIKRMYQSNIYGFKDYIVIRSIIFFYRNLMYKGRPFIIRELLKSTLRKIH